MDSIAYIPGSDGSGNASQMTVQNVRSSGASDILVNTVTGVPAKFFGSMGEPHTFTDPVTSETITVISEATAVDFAGHVDSGKIVIDSISPGYADTRGSLVGDIVIVRPTTEWANNLHGVLSQSHDDDGTLKAGAVDAAAVLATDVVETAKIKDGAVTKAKLSLATSTDANGWTVYDFNSFKQYRKRVTFSQAFTAGTVASLSISSTNLPSGVAALGTNLITINPSLSGNASDLNIICEMTALHTTLNLVARSFGTTTYAGFIDILIITA